MTREIHTFIVTTVKLTLMLQLVSQMAAGELLVKVVLDDPAGNSYLQNIYAPDPDPNMSITDYERTFDQNEDLGLNDMKTEGYQAIDEEDEPEDKWEY